MFIFQHEAHILIDSRSKRSFVSTTFSCHADRSRARLDCELVIQTPLAEVIIKKMLFRECVIKVGEAELEANLIQLEIRNFDTILGMD